MLVEDEYTRLFPSCIAYKTLEADQADRAMTMHQ